ncbi:RIP metalloprotease RseP [Patescibacteria group bacterium]|nr:RIP metalloprotease RseP [Patescibacteria group bacterium]MBU3999689.1 RIP metalloprotease RseP [Patescibacteria group bacterium]MBU4056418.1 RIP metalloprotease RseP [Patescibacteria group bacterium]MBU4368942.1 RIP metalloprotease RseP [Patescibacteria group bacterium]
MLIITLIIFLLVLGVLIFVHELGHFLAARREGVVVEEFGFGFPPRIFGFQRGETIYSINLIPLGGFVRIKGEDGENRDDPNSFASKSIFSRFKMLFAGVAANILLAVFLFSIIFFIGAPVVLDKNASSGKITDMRVMIVDVSANSPAYSSGIKSGDTVLSLKDTNGSVFEVKTAKDIQDFIEKNRGKEIVFTVKRGSGILELKTGVRESFPEGQGPTGIGLAEVGTVSYPWYEAIWQGAKWTFEVAVFVILAFLGLLKGLVISGTAGGQLTGPVGIAVLTGEAARLGFSYILQFTALLSINLAIINFLPFPALDGGRILFLAIEKIKGRPVSRELEGAVHTAGFMTLILLMVIITFRDFQTYNVWERVVKLFG